MSRTKSTTDETLLSAAQKVFLADGIGASTKKIAAEAGVSEGILFQRFGSKKALFFKAMRLPEPELTKAIRASERSKDPVRGLLALAVAALDYYRSVMPIVLLVLSHPARQEVLKQHGSEAHSMLLEAFGINAAFDRYFARLVEEGKVPTRDYASLVAMLLATLLTRALHEQIGLDDVDSSAKWLRKIVKATLS